MSVVVALVILALSPLLSGQSPAAPPREPVVTTVLNSHEGYVGGVIVDQLGYVYVADFQETVWRFNPHKQELQQWATGLYGASGNTFTKNGHLIQANFYGHSISEIARDGSVKVLVDEGLNGPVGLVQNQAGELFVCNCNDQSIMKVASSGHVSLFAKSPHFACPNGITRDADDNLYVVSFSGSKVVKIDPKGATSVFADSEGRGLGHITRVRNVFYATSFWDNKIYRISPTGSVTVLAGTGARGQLDGPGRAATFSNPNGIYADASGRYLYVNDYIGDPNATGTASTPFSLRRIELPNLSRILQHAATQGSLEDVRALYKEFVTDPANQGEDNRVSINALGWTFMTQERHAEAVAIFELNAESYPDWWNAHSSLGAAYMQVGDNDRAIAALRRSVELNPDNLVAKDRLKTLGVEL